MEVNLDDQGPSHDAPMVMKDIESFQSPVDGSSIIGRRSLREHNRRNNVTNADDFKNQWAEQRKQRERFFQGDPSHDRKERVEVLKDAWEKHRRR